MSLAVQDNLKDSDKMFALEQQITTKRLWSHWKIINLSSQFMLCLPFQFL